MPRPYPGPPRSVLPHPLAGFPTVDSMRLTIQAVLDPASSGFHTVCGNGKMADAWVGTKPAVRSPCTSNLVPATLYPTGKHFFVSPRPPTGPALVVYEHSQPCGKMTVVQGPVDSDPVFFSFFSSSLPSTIFRGVFFGIRLYPFTAALYSHPVFGFLFFRVCLCGLVGKGDGGHGGRDVDRGGGGNVQRFVERSMILSTLKVRLFWAFGPFLAVSGRSSGPGSWFRRSRSIKSRPSQ